ncbi:hypothetical protein Tco_0811212 [Tanacetum coccineum]
MLDKSSPLKRLIIEINVWGQASGRRKYFYPATDFYASNLTPTDCMERVSCESFLRWVEAEWLVSRLKMRNGEDFSYIGSMFPLMYQLMAVKKTSLSEMEYSGSVVASIPDVVEDQNKALSDT